jgi:hypothetical protein
VLEMIENRVDIVGRDSVPIVLDRQKRLAAPPGRRGLRRHSVGLAGGLTPRHRDAVVRSTGLTRLPSRTSTEPGPPRIRVEA